MSKNINKKKHEVFIVTNNTFPDTKNIETLVCSIFSADHKKNIEESYSLLYGINKAGYQIDVFIKYFNFGGCIARGDSTGEWKNAYDYSTTNQTFSIQIEHPEWTPIDAEMLNELHQIKWDYLELIENIDDSFLVPKDNFYTNLKLFEKNKIWTAYASENFDDEKLINFSDFWEFPISWK